MGKAGGKRRRRPKRGNPGALSVHGSLTTAQRAIVLVIGLAYCVGVASHWGYLNGVEQLTDWVWAWRDLGIPRTASLLATPFALVAGVLWVAEREQSRSRLPALLGLLVAASFLFQLLGAEADPRGLALVRQIAASRGATSYFFDATRIHVPLREWLAEFHTAQLERHSQTHPAGPIVFYYAFLTVFGPSVGALLGGCAVGLLGSAGVVVMYAFAGLWTADPGVRLTACAWYALLPAMTVFFPEFDQAYPIFSMLAILFWVRSLDARRSTWTYALALGAVLFVATGFAYNLLVIGAFLLYYAGYWLWREQWMRPAWIAMLRTGGLSFLVCIGLYVALWLAAGYDPIASFQHAMANQARLASITVRPYLTFALLDPFDFVLGAGVLAAPILFFRIRREGIAGKQLNRPIALTLIGIATILTIDASGLLRGEAARVWIFLQPLVVVPVALELATLRRPWRLSIFALQWLILVSLKAEMTFVNP